jgi:hypothetical protein
MTFSLFSSIGLLESYFVSVLERQIDASLSLSFQTAALTASSRCTWESSTRNWWKPALNLKRNKEKAQLMFGGCLMMEVRTSRTYTREQNSCFDQFNKLPGKWYQLKNNISVFSKPINYLIAAKWGQEEKYKALFFSFTWKYSSLKS